MAYEDAHANQPVVIDNGTGIVKAGFAGGDFPDAVFPSFVGRPKHQRVMAGAVDDDFFVGSRAEELRGLLALKYPVSHGIVEDWNDMERIWTHLYTKELNISPEDHPVLLTEAALNPRKNREKAAEIFFETFNVPALFVSMQAVLSLYASGRTTGVVLDSGDGVTHAVPIFEGFSLPHSIIRMDVAGRDVTNHLQLLLRRSGYHFHTSAELEVVRQIKEQTCYVAYNVQKEEGPDDVAATTPFTLPDGHVIQVGAERFRAAEVLFNPSLVGLEYGGLHEALVSSITKADLDLRRTLFSQIVLSGGSTLFPGFGDRLLNEVRRRAPKDIKVRISAPPERKYSTWIGGSILASLASFKKMWVSAEEWKEDHNVLIRKTF